VPRRGTGAEQDVGDLADGDRVAVLVAHQRAGDVGGRTHAPGLAHRQLEPFDVRQVAGTGGAVRMARGVDHVLHRQPVQQQLFLPHVHLVFGQLAADRDHLRHARHGENPKPQTPNPKPQTPNPKPLFSFPFLFHN
jgi:hypothetical protein